MHQQPATQARQDKTALICAQCQYTSRVRKCTGLDLIHPLFCIVVVLGDFYSFGKTRSVTAGAYRTGYRIISPLLHWRGLYCGPIRTLAYSWLCAPPRGTPAAIGTITTELAAALRALPPCSSRVPLHKFVIVQNSHQRRGIVTMQESIVCAN